MKTLEIRFLDLIDCPPGFETAEILERLRKAEIPVIGLFSFQGVKSGVMYEQMSPDGLGFIYHWREA
jgi:hypothetical protein